MFGYVVSVAWLKGVHPDAIKHSVSLVCIITRETARSDSYVVAYVVHLMHALRLGVTSSIFRNKLFTLIMTCLYIIHVRTRRETQIHMITHKLSCYTHLFNQASTCVYFYFSAMTTTNSMSHGFCWVFNYVCEVSLFFGSFIFALFPFLLHLRSIQSTQE